MKFGYIRADGIEDQKEQVRKLYEAGCDRVVNEKIDGKLNRYAWDSLQEHLREKDELIVSSVYILPLTALQAIEFFHWAKGKNIKLTSIREPYLHIETISLLYSLNKLTKSERSRAIIKGIKSTGRKKGLSQKAIMQAHAAVSLYESSDKSIKEIMETLQIKSKSTFYQRLDYLGLKFRRK